MELDEQRFDAAAAAYDRAEELLGERPWESDDVCTAQWLEVMVVGRPSSTSSARSPSWL